MILKLFSYISLIEETSFVRRPSKSRTIFWLSPLATDEAGAEGEAAEVPEITSVSESGSAEGEGLGEVVGEITRQSGLGEELEGVDGPEEVAVEEGNRSPWIPPA